MDPITRVFGRDIASLVYQWLFRIRIRDVNQEYVLAFTYGSGAPHNRAALYSNDGAVAYNWRDGTTRDPHVYRTPQNDPIAMLPLNWYL